MREPQLHPMRILLDESVPERLGDLLIPHTWSSVRRQGWAGLKNGKLLAAASAHFDLLLTADKSMEFQQNLATLPMAIVVMRAHSNRVEVLSKVIPDVLVALEHLQPRTLVKVAA
jgi:predicted nuclease of predicted toxin-antitoxin system